MGDTPPELVCYVHDGWAPRIRPASSKRAWMEDTPERFAYRCLPLVIANAHGWEIGSPCGFDARWNGGAGVDAVEIRVDPDTPSHRAPVSLFGHGTITFHIEGLIRTAPGWNLWVGGAPNGAKDGIAPLGGVIETDWSPYSFTMNWRFTRPDHWVRFAFDEPFCFFFPVQRGVLDDVEPELRPIDDNPELRDAFKRWSASREAFQDWVAKTEPAAPADRWQKLYYRGLDPNGKPGVPDHESKLRLAPFEGLVETPAPPSCPARPAPARARPTAELALARRDWLMETAERQRALSPQTGGILRVRDLKTDDFLDHFYAPARPVVIEGALRDWPALARWTLDYLDAPLPSDASADLGELSDFLSSSRGDIAVARDAFAPLRRELENVLWAHIAGSTRLILLPPSETPKLADDHGAVSDIDDVTDVAKLAARPEAQGLRAFDLAVSPGDLVYIPVGWWHQSWSIGATATVRYRDFRWPNETAASFPTEPARAV